MQSVESHMGAAGTASIGSCLWSGLPADLHASSKGMAAHRRHLPVLFLASIPPTSDFSEHFGLDLLLCVMHSCGAASPPWSMGELEAVCLRGFLPDLSVHVADKRPFSPSSLYKYVAVSSLVLYQWFAHSAFPLLYLPWHRSLDFSVVLILLWLLRSICFYL